MIAWVKALAVRVQRADTASYAAALAFNFLFALFPLLLFSAALLAMLHLPSVAHDLTGPLAALIPRALRHLILATIASASRFKSPTLLSVGALGFLFSMSSAIRQLSNALNHAYRVPKVKRKLWTTLSLSFGLGLLFGILIVASLILSAIGGDIIRWMALVWFHHPPGSTLQSSLRWLTLLALLWIILTLIYNWLPDHGHRFHWMTLGTGIVMMLWIAISLGFSLYAAHFNHYNRTYGSLGAVILMMLYLYVLSFALLLGGEVNALMSKDASQS